MTDILKPYKSPGSSSSYGLKYPTYKSPGRFSNEILNPAGPEQSSIYGLTSPTPDTYGGWGEMQSVMNPNFDASSYMKANPAIFGEQSGGGIWDSIKNSGFFSSKDDTTGKMKQGWGGEAMDMASGLMSGYLGMKQYGIAKKTLSENKRQFDANYAVQKNLTNSRLEGRQKARIAASPDGGHMSAADYVQKYGVK